MKNNKGKSRLSSWLNRNTFGISLTGFFSDTSHEMATSALPEVLTTISDPHFALGIIEEVSVKVPNIIKLFAGWISGDLEKVYKVNDCLWNLNFWIYNSEKIINSYNV